MKLKPYAWPLYCVLLALLGQLYFLPFSDSSYVFSMGVLLLETLLPILWRQIPPVRFTLVTGVLIAGLRLLSPRFFGAGNYLTNFAAVVLFYVVFAGVSVGLIRWRKLSGLEMFPCLLLGDILGNLAELLFTDSLAFQKIQIAVVFAMVRVLIAAVLYQLYRRNQMLLIQEYHEKRYMKLNQIAADLYADIFYLNKSRDDLEQLTQNCYALYDQLKDQTDYAGQALRLATGIHEIKKDYTRILSGLNGVLDSTRKSDNTMQLSELLRLVERGTRDALLSPEYAAKPAPELNFYCDCEERISDFYDLFIILNNLIINAIQADAKKVSVSAAKIDTQLTLTITDDGSGIEDDVLPYLFAPGFSTKMTENGALSAGIGLCHVEGIVKKRGGTIAVKNHPQTMFIVELPIEKV